MWSWTPCWRPLVYINIPWDCEALAHENVNTWRSEKVPFLETSGELVGNTWCERERMQRFTSLQSCVIQWKSHLTMMPNTIVEKKPPMKPSHVFLGDSCRGQVQMWTPDQHHVANNTFNELIAWVSSQRSLTALFVFYLFFWVLIICDYICRDTDLTRSTHSP